MIKHLSRFALAATLACSALSLNSCVEADNLPTQPNEDGIRLATHVKDWRDEVIYQVIVDRFYNGDINNDYNVDTRSLGKYHGGDWQGIIDKLDYLQELGVTTLWISPPVKNVEEDAGFASYHGYWTVDFLKHNPHFGDLATLRRLSDELHKRNMKLILDIVTNHVGQVFFYDINMNGSAQEWLAGRGDIDKGDYNRPSGGELSRVTEYDPDFSAHGIDAYTSMGISGQAPIVFFDIPSINRTAPGPQNIDLNGNGTIDDDIERLGFANPEWYHQKGRTYDYDTQLDYNYDKRGYNITPKYPKEMYSSAGLDAVNSNAALKNCRGAVGYGEDGNFYDPWTPCTQVNDCCELGRLGSPYTHRLTNYDGSAGNYLDGEPRQYYQNDQTLLGDFPGGLKDVATEREDVRKAMIQVFSYWIDVTDCDGFRIDTLKHVEYSFWETFAPAIRQHAKKRGKKNFLMFGEAFDGNDDLLAAYTTNENSVDSVFLFSQKYAIDQAFQCAQGNSVAACSGGQNSTSALVGWDGNSRHEKFSGTPRPDGVVDANGDGVAPRDLLVNFLDNHDVNRYLYKRRDAKGVDSLKNALAFLILQRGIPCIYYGTEQGFFGGNDPGNRENMSDPTASIFTQLDWAKELYPKYKPWDTRNPLFTHIKKTIKLRKSNPVLSHGAVSNVRSDGSIFAFTRSLDGTTAVIVVNTHETQSATYNDGAISGKSDALEMNDQPCQVNGSSVTIPPMTTCVLM